MLDSGYVYLPDCCMFIYQVVGISPALFCFMAGLPSAILVVWSLVSEAFYCYITKEMRRANEITALEK